MSKFNIRILCLIGALMSATSGFCMSNDSIGVYFILHNDSTASITSKVPQSNDTMQVNYRQIVYNCNGPIVFPDTIRQNDMVYIVTRIEDKAFEGSLVQDITLSNKIVYIGREAFENCQSLEQFNMGNTGDPIEKISPNAFAKSGIRDIYGSRIIKELAWCAFYKCKNLETINGNIIFKEIDFEAFEACTRLKKIPLQEGVTYIGDNAFSDCFSLDTIKIPSTARVISENAFSRCGNIVSIEVDSRNQYFDSRDNCNAIIRTGTNELILGCKNTKIPNSVQSIGKYAFRGCEGLVSMILSDNITSFGGDYDSYAFQNCRNLTTIIFPNSITQIPSDICSGNTKLQYVYIPPSVTKIEHDAFENCDSLKYIVLPKSIKDLDWSFGYGNKRDTLTIYTPNPVPFRSLKKNKRIKQLRVPEEELIYCHPFSFYIQIQMNLWKENQKKYYSKRDLQIMMNDSALHREIREKYTNEYINYHVSKIAANPQIGRYNADLEVFPITDKTYGTVYLFVPYDDWQYVKQNWNGAQFYPTYQMIGDKIQYKKLTVRMPNNKDYHANPISFNKH